jgi:hypothetical protein
VGERNESLPYPTPCGSTANLDDIQPSVWECVSTGPSPVLGLAKEHTSVKASTIVPVGSSTHSFDDQVTPLYGIPYTSGDSNVAGYQEPEWLQATGHLNPCKPTSSSGTSGILEPGVDPLAKLLYLELTCGDLPDIPPSFVSDPDLPCLVEELGTPDDALFSQARMYPGLCDLEGHVMDAKQMLGAVCMSPLLQGPPMWSVGTLPHSSSCTRSVECADCLVRLGKSTSPTVSSRETASVALQPAESSPCLRRRGRPRIYNLALASGVFSFHPLACFPSLCCIL